MSIHRWKNGTVSKMRVLLTEKSGTNTVGRKASGETFWNHIYPTEHSLIPGDKKDLDDDERQRKISLTTKAEQEIVNQYVRAEITPTIL